MKKRGILKKAGMLFMVGILAVGTLTGCGEIPYSQIGNGVSKEDAAAKVYEGVTNIVLSDQGITVDGAVISKEESAAVYAANDIAFYLAGQDFTYGEGTESDAHTQAEADAHTVVHITKPGTYAVTGSLSAGQIAVDLGEEAKTDESAVVTLILNNMDITCTVAPAVIFYSVYECGSADAETATKDVDTSAAGANVVIADGTYNVVNGSYVAKVYKSYELSEDGTEVINAKKLHKYDGAFYSKMSMNMNGEEEGTGVLEINAENEGLDTELHLTINGGNIKITSGNDGINTNEDYVSVTTVNGGTLVIGVSGTTGEGDGIDSNGWLVINGGTVVAYACGTSGDAGIDSDKGIHINGGTVLATGNMLDAIGEGEQTYAVFSFADRQNGGKDIVLKNEKNKAVGKWVSVNNYGYLIVAGDFLEEGTYSLWIGDEQYAGAEGSQNMGFGFGGMNMGGNFEMPEGFEGGNFEMPEGFEGGNMPQMPEGFEGGNFEMPEGFEGGNFEMPEDFEGGNFEMPEGFEGGNMPQMPEGFEGGEMPQMPGGMQGGFGGRGESVDAGELSTEFVISAGGNYFNYVSVQSAEKE